MGISSNHVRASALLILSISLFVSAEKPNGVYNVRDFGARGNGKNDDTKAFEKAWTEACRAGGKPFIVIPSGDYLVGPLMFRGPCKGPIIRVQLHGRLMADTNLNAFKHKNWIEFRDINGLRLSGRGKLDGRGELAWPRNACHLNPNCKRLPVSLVLRYLTNAEISSITSLNSKLAHIHVYGCKNLHLTDLTLSAPADSPNTDGIDIADSRNVTLDHSTIGTGDDCVAILPGSADIRIADVACGPGHGISIGSLGKRNHADEDDVVGVNVSDCTFVKTDNGVRIKTWQSSPSASRARELRFEHLRMKDVQNPIVIDQKYCPYNACDTKWPSKVKISDVKFRDIRGTSATAVAVKLVCSDAAPCTNVELSDIDLKYASGNPSTQCVNVNGVSNGRINPPSCIR